MTCKYTRIIHGRGWTVISACEYWEIRYDVWRRKCRNDRKTKAQLLSMCRGLENKTKRICDGKAIQE